MQKVNEIATGLAIKQKCIESNLTPKELSNMFNVSLTTPYLWFTGKAMPRVDTLVALCGIFGCKIDDVIVTEADDEQ
ncbi:MAG: helix-turn-helix transcriptional regulator [Paludibacteraceae bacterium]|nr:helix-turn-helix transcriptional regulator [Paludibacteraceae bacterium]